MRLARGEHIPAFGHKLYPDGDPRAAALLPRLPTRSQGQRLIDAMRTMTGIAPNIDFALLMVEKRLGLPDGAAFAMFAVGRTVGWIAHALEQWRDDELRWPRAVYPEDGGDGWLLGLWLVWGPWFGFACARADEWGQGRMGARLTNGGTRVTNGGEAGV